MSAVRWAHQPLEVRQALRKYRIAPQTQQCHTNSQRLYMYATELRDRLVYREGVVTNGIGLAFEHAWLTLDGAVVDLTLDANAYTYGDSYAVPWREVVDHWVSGSTVPWIRVEQLWRVHSNAVRRALRVSQ